MPSVINLKKMGAVGRCGYIWHGSSFTPSQRMEEKRRENLENSSQPRLRIQHTWEEHATWLSLKISELVMQATRTHKQGARFDGTMFRVAGTAHRRSCSALWTSWGEMWVEAVKKYYLSTWVPFRSYFLALQKINFKKKSVQAIKACWWGSCLSLCTHGLNWGAECLLEKQGLCCGCGVTPMPTPLCLEVVLLQCTAESSPVLLFQFVCSTQTWEGEGCREGQN